MSLTKSDNNDDEWEALVKGRKWKAGRLHDWSKILSHSVPLKHFTPKTVTLTCCFWWSSDSVIGAVRSSASLTKGFSINIKKQWRGRGHFPFDFELASLMTRPSCYTAVIKVIRASGWFCVRSLIPPQTTRAKNKCTHGEVLWLKASHMLACAAAGAKKQNTKRAGRLCHVKVGGDMDSYSTAQSTSQDSNFSMKNVWLQISPS